MGDHFVVTPSAIGQPTWPTQPSIPPESVNECYSGLRRQTAEGVVRGLAYRPRQRVFLAGRLECRLAAGSKPRNGDELSAALLLWESLLAIGDFVFVLDSIIFIAALLQSLYESPAASLSSTVSESECSQLVLCEFEDFAVTSDVIKRMCANFY